MARGIELHRILVKGEVLFDKLGQTEFFARMEDLAIEYYQTGSPHPDTITTEIIIEEN